MIKKESTHETGKSLYLPFKRKIQEKKLIQKRRRGVVTDEIKSDFQGLYCES